MWVTYLVEDVHHAVVGPILKSIRFRKEQGATLLRLT